MSALHQTNDGSIDAEHLALAGQCRELDIDGRGPARRILIPLDLAHRLKHRHTAARQPPGMNLTRVFYSHVSVAELVRSCRRSSQNIAMFLRAG